MAIQSSWWRCRTVSRSGFFHSAHRASLSALVCPRAERLRLWPRAAPRAAFQAMRRCSSSASVTHVTTWYGSAARMACGQCAAMTWFIQTALSEVMWVICAHRSGPSRVKNAVRLAWSAPLPAHTRRPES